MSARRAWSPVLARMYGIPPWGMQHVTIRELRLIQADLDRLRREAEQHG